VYIYVLMHFRRAVACIIYTPSPPDQVMICRTFLLKNTRDVTKIAGTKIASRRRNRSVLNIHEVVLAAYWKGGWVYSVCVIGL
jgi:hypothetical protein